MTKNELRINKDDRAIKNISPVMQDVRAPQRVFGFDVVISSRPEPGSYHLRTDGKVDVAGMVSFLRRMTGISLTL